MPDYFLIHDADFFERRLRPALAASLRCRSFDPCRTFCCELLPRVTAFSQRYHLGPDESLVQMVASGLAFDRDFWRALVGEVLLYAATDVPEFPTCLDTLSCLVTSDQRLVVQQAHRGTRELTFGHRVYQPDTCGYNDADAVRRIADGLTAIDPDAWLSTALTSLEEEDREEELAFAHDWFPSLREMYQRAAAEKQIVVWELV